jgi:hypothetical protein
VTRVMRSGMAGGARRPTSRHRWEETDGAPPRRGRFPVPGDEQPDGQGGLQAVLGGAPWRTIADTPAGDVLRRFGERLIGGAS